MRREGEKNRRDKRGLRLVSTNKIAEEVARKASVISKQMVVQVIEVPVTGPWWRGGMERAT